MLKRVLSAFMGTRHERDRKKVQPIVDAIHEHEQRLAAMSDEALLSLIAEAEAADDVKVLGLIERLRDEPALSDADGAGSITTQSFTSPYASITVSNAEFSSVRVVNKANGKVIAQAP